MTIEKLLFMFALVGSALAALNFLWVVARAVFGRPRKSERKAERTIVLLLDQMDALKSALREAQEREDELTRQLKARTLEAARLSRAHVRATRSGLSVIEGSGATPKVQAQAPNFDEATLLDDAFGAGYGTYERIA